MTANPNPITLRRLRAILKTRFNGVVKHGKHDENGECCVLELASVARGIGWTDDPMMVRSFDLRLLNDIMVSDDLRTEWMPRLLVAYDDSLDWSLAKRKAVVSAIVIGVVNQLIAELPGLTVAVREQCRKAKSLGECKEAAAYAARDSYAARDYHNDAHAAAAHAAAAARDSNDDVHAANAVRAAHDAAATAADRAAAAAADAASERVFVTTCKIWLSAAQRQENA